ERQSRFVVLVRVPGKDTESVVNALVRQVKSLPAGLMSTLTWDRGTELADHKRFTVVTDVRSTSAIRKAHGSEAVMRTQMDCYDSTSPRGADLAGYHQKHLNA